MKTLGQALYEELARVTPLDTTEEIVSWHALEAGHRASLERAASAFLARTKTDPTIMLTEA